MALANLKSAYSFYTKSAPGFKPNASVNDTDFQYKDDLTAVAVEAGFTNYGSLIRFRNRKSLNEFNLSDQGTSTRIQQLGTGTKFPIGPKGQVHEFDKVRGGFSIKNRYEDNYGSLSNAGLADTYTKNSPIDDMYNIVKVRDVASRRQIFREPFILRGIQRDDNSDPQRFGPTITLDLPRAGVLTGTNRMALDLLRIGKFMLTPKGLLFNVKQFGQQLMNPNVEGINGKPAKIFNPNSTKLYTPINLMANVAGGYLGLRSRRHGLLPGGSSPGAPGRYEDIFKQRGAILSKNKTKHNRLVRLGEELGLIELVKEQIRSIEPAGVNLDGVGGKINKAVDKIRDKLGYKGQVINTLTSITGPGSVGGIGRTTITRAVDTPAEQIKFNDNGQENTRTTRNENTKKLKEIQDEFGQFNGLRGKVEELDFDGIGTSPLKETDTAEKSKNTNNLPAGDIKAYKTLAYGNIPKREGRREHLDFRTGKSYDVASIPLSKFVDTSKDILMDDISGVGNNLDQKNDLINFTITNSSLGETARFLCYLTSFSDQLGQDVDLVDVSGYGDEEEGADQSPITRTVAISLMVAARHPDELAKIYDNIDKIRWMTSVANFASGRSRVTLGNLVKDLDCYVNSVAINWDTEYMFDLDTKVPFVLDMDLDFTIPEVSINYELGYRG